MSEKIDGILRKVFKEEIAREENPSQPIEFVLTPCVVPDPDICLPGPKPFSRDALKNVLKRRPKNHKPNRKRRK